MLSHVFTIHGIPRTKKTSNQGVVVPVKKAGRPTGKLRAMMFPAQEWREWVKTARIVYDDGLIVMDHHRAVFLPASTPPIGWVGIGADMNCCATFFLQRRQHGDPVGYYQGLADLLEERGVIENDRFIRSWDGTRLERDEEHPRVEVKLQMLGTSRPPFVPSDQPAGPWLLQLVGRDPAAYAAVAAFMVQAMHETDRLASPDDLHAMASLVLDNMVKRG